MFNEIEIEVAIGIVLAGVIILVGTLVLPPGAPFGGIVLAQNPDPQTTGSIQAITGVDTESYGDR